MVRVPRGADTARMPRAGAPVALVLATCLRCGDLELTGREVTVGVDVHVTQVSFTCPLCGQARRLDVALGVAIALLRGGARLDLTTDERLPWKGGGD